jgi:hypothetical protein
MPTRQNKSAKSPPSPGPPPSEAASLDLLTRAVHEYKSGAITLPEARAAAAAHLARASNRGVTPHTAEWYRHELAAWTARAGLFFLGAQRHDCALALARAAMDRALAAQYLLADAQERARTDAAAPIARATPEPD